MHAKQMSDCKTIVKNFKYSLGCVCIIGLLCFVFKLKSVIIPYVVWNGAADQTELQIMAVVIWGIAVNLLPEMFQCVQD